MLNLEVSPDGQTVLMITGDDSGRVLEVSMAGGPARTLVTRDLSRRPDIAWSPDGTRFVVADEDRLTLYDADGGNETVIADREIDPDLNNRIGSVTWGPNGSIYALTFGNALRINPDTGARDSLRALGEDYNAIESRGIDASPDGSRIVVTCFRDTPSEQNVQQLCIHDSDFNLLTSIDTSGANVVPEFAVYSPVGSQIAFNGSDPVDTNDASLYTINADGSGLALQHNPSEYGLPSWAVQPSRPPQPFEEPPPPPTNAPLVPTGFDGDPATNERADFADPVLYAAAVSQARFGGIGSERPAEHVVLSRDDAFADSLVGADLTKDAPLLFTQTDSLPATTGAEIDRLLPEDGRVYILGGVAAVSDAVATQLDARYEVVRLEGPSRVETSVAVAGEVLRLGGDATTLAVARAGGPADNPTAGWADSVSGGAWSAATQTPTVVTDTASIHPAVQALLDDQDFRTTVLFGGEFALSDAIEAGVPGPQRISGASRAGTAQSILSDLLDGGGEDRRLVVINGYREDGWLFGLPAAGLAAHNDAAIALSQDPVPPETAAMACSPADVDLLFAGGLGVITEAAAAGLDSVPAC